MNRNEFCKYHWEYYLVLEKDFLKTERYVNFDLGENHLYDNKPHDYNGNSETFSNEYIKQYQSICSEIDVILKGICKELGTPNASKMDKSYTPIILSQWPYIVTQKVKFKDFELQPFVNWKENPYHSPDWWSPHNDVKHERIENYKKANLKNVVNALAALYILELYFVKYIGIRDNDRDVPNDISQLFEIIKFTTKHTVVGRESYLVLPEEIDAMFD